MLTTEETYGDSASSVPTPDNLAETLGARQARYQRRMRYEFVCTGLAGIVSLAAVAGALFAFPTPGNRPIAGLACSIVATDRISQAIGAEIQLAPSDGRVCTYDGLREPVRVVTIALATEPSRPLPAQARLAFSPDNRPVLVYVHGGPPQLAVARTEAVVRAIESVP